MKDFFLKYKYNILYIFVIMFLMVYFVPYQEKFYLKKDIKNFKSHFYWEMIFIITILILVFFISRIFKEKVKNYKSFFFPVVNVTLYVLFFAFIFQQIIISVVLFSNRIIDRSQTVMSYKVGYYQEHVLRDIISETKTDTIDANWEAEFINRLDVLRLKKKLKTINKSDTIHVRYGNGLFGIRYLKK